MSKELLYLLCAGALKERELYTLFRESDNPGYLETRIKLLVSAENLKEARAGEKLMARYSMKVTSLLEEDYPAPLRSINLAPPVLFYCGEYLPEDSEAVAFVGSRDASEKGRLLTEKFVSAMKGIPVTIVSGMARGIDTSAHRAALDNGLRTIAVLGSGLDVIYPAQNKSLFNAIISGRGAVFSEHPPGMPPLAHNFPRRNRVISGLSKAVVIVEAGEKSGSLITGRVAMEQGRELFAVPRTPSDKNASGTNNLIKIGAKIATSAEDILADVFSGLSRNEMVQKSIPLGADEAKLLAALGEEPVHIDQLCFILDTGPATLANFLLNMELKGLIRELPGKHYVKN